MLHLHYEKRREQRAGPESDAWKWDYKSDEFSTNYLGHILHYLEGVIVEIRNKPRRGD
jgi:hypothetical protein